MCNHNVISIFSHEGLILLTNVIIILLAIIILVGIGFILIMLMFTIVDNMSKWLEEMKIRRMK